jgi:hypothetical protein
MKKSQRRLFKVSLSASNERRCLKPNRMKSTWEEGRNVEAKKTFFLTNFKSARQEWLFQQSLFDWRDEWKIYLVIKSYLREVSAFFKPDPFHAQKAELICKPEIKRRQNEQGEKLMTLFLCQLVNNWQFSEEIFGFTLNAKTLY